jgi:primosomal protein N' (replication factor Y)
MTIHAEVIIPLAVPKTFTYSVPGDMRDRLIPGSRVEVEFGGAKRYAGIVSSVSEGGALAFQPKPILNLLDVEPVVHAEQLDLWKWISEYYLCSQGEVMAAALPAHFKLSSETILMYNEEYGDDFTHLDGEEYLVAEGLLLRGELRLEEVQDILDISHVYPVVKRLIEKRVCIAWESLKERYTPKKETFVRLAERYASEEALEGLLNGWEARAPKQLELLMAYLHLARSEGEVRQSDLLKKSGAGADRVKTLADKGILVLEKRSVDRIRPMPREVHIDFELSEKQTLALEAVRTALAEKPVCLLHGVTSSGKTLLYIRLMHDCLKTGRQVLFLLPEIALTAQVIRRLQHHFGGYISVYHSKFSSNERVEIWNKVRSGETRILLGARSALFLPFCDLGLVIVDEEHDPSYKQQDPAPRYHARDTAIHYASRLGAKVLLGSATPSLESYRNAVTGKYGLVTMDERFGGIEMPNITLVDMRVQTPPKGPRPILSEPLLAAMRDALAAGKQAILFQNRRGYSPYMVCGLCSHIPHCDHCDVTLTYHKLLHRLQCHYCGATYPRPLTCPACGSSKWQERNFGTERIEEELMNLMPEAKVGRMDFDSVKGKAAHDALIQTFEQRQLDILVGTQMVVKGLDFEHVSLVGILDADGLLGFADFRVNERAFQLMEQVSGRAGRKGSRGNVLIQTTQTGHPVLDYVLRHDYTGFYAFEAEARARYGYPPFTRIIRLTFRHKYRDRAEACAAMVAANLTPLLGPYLIGPAEPVVNRVRQMYRTELVLKLPRETTLVARARSLLRTQFAIIGNDRQYRSVLVDADVDPV